MNMTPKQIQALRIAVAEVAGWRVDQIEASGMQDITFTPPGLSLDAWQNAGEIPPNYPADLNAVHELEMGLTDEKLIRYGYFLSDVMTWRWPTRSASTFATALQRCIALLMTLAPDKWLEIQNLKD